MESQSFLNHIQYIIWGKRSQRCENGAKEGQETWTETNMQVEGAELGEKSELKISEGHENDTCYKSQWNKIFWTEYILYIYYFYVLLLKANTNHNFSLQRQMVKKSSFMCRTYDPHFNEDFDNWLKHVDFCFKHNLSMYLNYKLFLFPIVLLVHSKQGLLAAFI